MPGRAARLQWGLGRRRERVERLRELWWELDLAAAQAERVQRPEPGECGAELLVQDLARTCTEGSECAEAWKTWDCGTHLVVQYPLYGKRVKLAA